MTQQLRKDWMGNGLLHDYRYHFRTSSDCVKVRLFSMGRHELMLESNLP